MNFSIKYGSRITLLKQLLFWFTVWLTIPAAMKMINHLLPKGFAVWTYDQRGHGRSPGKRCYTNRFTDLVNDLDIFVTLVKQKNAELPVFIVGHSLGALESVFFIANHQPRNISGLVVSGLVLKIGQSVPQIMLALAGVISVLVPRLGVQHLDCRAVSRDDSVVESYIKDPLVYSGKIPARTGAEMIGAMSSVQSKLSAITMPLLILHGASDQLAEPSGSQLMYDSVGSTDKTLHLFPGCFHEIFNEPCRDVVLDITSDWLLGHLLTKPAVLS